MGNRRPIKTKDWIRFLEAHDCQYKRTKASHSCYKCKGAKRPIVVREAHKEIPVLHLHTSLKSLGKTFDYLYAWLEGN